MTIGIYSIILRSTEEVLWVGQSTAIERRFRQHLNLLQRGAHSQASFSEWFHKSEVTAEDLALDILEESAAEELNGLEAKWFKLMSPRFFGQAPSSSRSWTLAEPVKEKISQTHKARVAAAKVADRYISVWEAMSAEARGFKAAANKRHGFTPETGRTAGTVGGATAKSELHKAALSKAATAAAGLLIECSACGKICKGKAALGRHTAAKHKFSK